MKQFSFNGITTDHVPNPLKLADGTSVSPVTEALFVSLGGTITDESRHKAS